MTYARACSVEGCNRPHCARGLCSAHYQRLKKPGGIGMFDIGTPKGARPAWIAAHVDFDGDDCLMWPFSCDPNGYGASSDGKRKLSAHRAMCLAAHGEPPSERHQAAHSCGKRACVNPRHIRWASASENCQDKLAHGTVLFGEKCRFAKLTELQVFEIRMRRLRGEKLTEIAAFFGVHYQHVAKICARRVWAHAA